MDKTRIFKTVKEYSVMAFALALYVFSWTAFLIPNQIPGGGVTGMSSIINYAFGIPISYSYLVINALLLIAGTIIMGKGFGFKTIYVIAFTSILFEVLPKFPVLEVLMDEKLLVVLVGAVMESVGIGLVLLRGGSTGGLDIIAMIINKFWPISVGRVYLCLDIFIISTLLLVPDKGLVDMIYAYLMMVAFSFGIDFVLLGNKSTVQILVFSENYKEVADYIINDMRRGVTALESVGWYTQKESKVLMIVARKNQMHEIVTGVKSIDKKAFISVSSAMSVYGEGFEDVKSGLKIKTKKEK